MRILYFGTSAFAVPAFEAILKSRHELVGIVTQPDRPSGRGLSLTHSAVKKAALELAPGVPILQPEKARTKEFRLAATSLSADVFVVASFGQILSQRLLNTPKYGGINIHGSLLPRWRGAAPMQYCLVAGDAETGVTPMQMDAGMDTGDILLQVSTPIDSSDTIASLETRLSALGADLILHTLDLLERGDCPRTPQDPALALYCPALPADFGYFDLSKPASQLINLMRGVSPRPGAFVGWDGRRIKVWSASAVASTEDLPESTPGAIIKIDATGIIVQAGQQTAIHITELQPDSRAKMGALQWARGARAQVGSLFESAR